jgi:type I restriction enzyme S subunit
LFARIGATTGKTCYINQEIRGVFGSYLIRFLPDANSQIDTKFLHLFTQSEMYWLQVNRIKGGQLKKGLNTQLLKEIKILLPPLEEQQKIAQVLSTVGKKLEIERNEKAKLERIKQGLMDLLLTGKIRIKVN